MYRYSTSPTEGTSASHLSTALTTTPIYISTTSVSASFPQCLPLATHTSPQRPLSSPLRSVLVTQPKSRTGSSHSPCQPACPIASSATKVVPSSGNRMDRLPGSVYGPSMVSGDGIPQKGKQSPCAKIILLGIPKPARRSVSSFVTSCR
jgi:hypothetical protein